MRLSLVLSLILVMAACSPAAPPATAQVVQPTLPPTVQVAQPTFPSTLEPEKPAQEIDMVLRLTTPAFEEGGSIPPRFTCTGEDISPALEWSEPPGGTQSFALIMDDPDAPSGTFVHWVIFNIPASSRGLSEAMPQGASLNDGTQQGLGSSHENGYMGPCPPSGTHRYFFKLYALDAMLTISSNVGAGDLMKALSGHILANAELMGTFKK